MKIRFCANWYTGEPYRLFSITLFEWFALDDILLVEVDFLRFSVSVWLSIKIEKYIPELIPTNGEFQKMYDTMDAMPEESECQVPYGDGERIRVADCPCRLCAKERTEIARRKWGKFIDYLSDNELSLYDTRQFPDWLDKDGE